MQKRTGIVVKEGKVQEQYERTIIELKGELQSFINPV